MKIHVVMFSWGEYSDREVKAEKAFSSIDHAQKYVKEQEAAARNFQQKSRPGSPPVLNIPDKYSYWIESIDLIKE